MPTTERKQSDRMASRLIRDIRASSVPALLANLQLALRILGDRNDRKGFLTTAERFSATANAIRPAIDTWEQFPPIKRKESA